MLRKQMFLYVAVIALCAIGATTCSAGTVWNPVTQMTSSNPSGAWTYGYYNAGTFTLDPAFVTDGEILGWRDNSSQNADVVANPSGSLDAPFLPHSVSMMTASPAYISVLRWTAPAAGNYQVAINMAPVLRWRVQHDRHLREWRHEWHRHRWRPVQPH